MSGPLPAGEPDPATLPAGEPDPGPRPAGEPEPATLPAGEPPLGPGRGGEPGPATRATRAGAERAGAAPSERGGLRPIVLLGPRGAGKTTVGRRLAAALDRPFVDLDLELAAVHARERGEPPRPAGELLLALGLPVFRDLEERVLAAVLARTDGPVVAPGAGCVERAASRERLARRARCVLLDVELAELRRRVALDPTFRPALEGADPIEEMARVGARRAPLYAALASVVVTAGGRSPDEIVRELVRHLGSA